VNDAVEQAGDTLQVLRLGSSSDPDGTVRTRYRRNGPGWVLVRPDQVAWRHAAAAPISPHSTHMPRVYCGRGHRPDDRRSMAFSYACSPDDLSYFPDWMRAN